MTDNLNTLPAILKRNSIQFAEKSAFREKEFGIWQSWSWKDVYEFVNNLSLGLIGLGIKEGDHIELGEALTTDPNVGGFGQLDAEIVLQNPARVIGLIVFFAGVALTQILLVLKKKQVEKVQAAEGI